MRKADVSPDRQQYLVKCGKPHDHCHALIPPPTPRMLPHSPAMQTQLQRAHEALGRLRADTAMLPNANLITRTLARREAVQSSQIEGTRTNLPELLEYEATLGQDGAPPDVTEVERYVRALAVGQQALDERQGRLAIGTELIKRMHRILLDGMPASLRPGQYRDKQVWIGGGRIEDATFVPPPPKAIAGCMKELESSMLRYRPREAESAVISIVARLAMAHAQFETIHPFFDGNGRIGRLIMPLLLAAEGYPPLYLSGYLLRYRRAYYDALADVQLRGRWDAWVIFLSEGIVRSVEAALAVARDLNSIHDEWSAALADLKAHSAARQFPRLLLGHPVVSVRQAAELLGISFVSANNAIKVMIERGILAEPKARRNRVFHATRMLERLGRE